MPEKQNDMGREIVGTALAIALAVGGLVALVVAALREGAKEILNVDEKKEPEPEPEEEPEPRPKPKAARGRPRKRPEPGPEPDETPDAAADGEPAGDEQVSEQP